MADIVKWSNQKGDFRCHICGAFFIPHWKMPNICTSCQRIVKTQRRKIGLTEIPKINKDVVAKRAVKRKQFIDWYREETESDNFGRKFKLKRQFDGK